MLKSQTESIQKIREMIRNGHLGRDERLPPERVLAQELGLTRHALRKSLAVLEGEGLIRRHVGQGTFVGGGPALEEAARGSLVNTTSPAEILEAKLVIEPQIAAMAATRANRREMEMMEDTARRCRDATNSADREKWDLTLHELITIGANNHLLHSVLKTIYDLRKNETWGRISQTVFTPARWAEYSSQHFLVVGAIRDRNAGEAEKMMRRHIETVKRHLMLGV
jgi:GntR family transcriptional regulator, uxu operon transcriptional repressor